MKPEKMILTAGPSITDKEKQYVADAVENGWNENWSKYIRKFEAGFAEFIGTNFAMSTSSCTGAMHLSLLALGVGPGDEVIVPELTWVATASVIKYVGATPRFCDVDENTWTMDPTKLPSLINNKTKALMPVHLYGHPAKMDDIMAIAKKHELLVIEDAAPAIGAECNGKKVGAFGDIGAYSFQGAKMLVTGEGGMLTTNNEEVMKRIQQLGDHGRSRNTETPFWIDKVGYKYKMSNMQAAFGLAQLERVNELIDKKRLIFNWYQKRLKDVNGLATNIEAEWAKSIYWMSSIYLKKDFGITRDELIKKLKSDMIDTRPAFPKISSYPMWETADNKIAEKVGNNSINLPSGHNLVEEQVDYICKSIIKHLGA